MTPPPRRPNLSDCRRRRARERMRGSYSLHASPSLWEDFSGAQEGICKKVRLRCIFNRTTKAPRLIPARSREAVGFPGFGSGERRLLRFIRLRCFSRAGGNRSDLSPRAFPDRPASSAAKKRPRRRRRRTAARARRRQGRASGRENSGGAPVLRSPAPIPLSPAGANAAMLPSKSHEGIDDDGWGGPRR